MAVHQECYSQIKQQLNEQDDTPGNYLTGSIGAILFGAIGSIPWIIVGMFGWIVSLLGLLIGRSANYGYKLFKGKESEGKLIVLVVTILLMVISASYTIEIIQLYKYFASEGITGISLIESFDVITEYITDNVEYGRDFRMNIMLGSIFAIVGSKNLIFEYGFFNTNLKENIELVR